MVVGAKDPSSLYLFFVLEFRLCVRKKTMSASNSLRLAWRSIPARVQKRLKPYIMAGMSGLLRQAGYGFVDHAGLFKHLKANGFSPQLLVDVGAFVGDWSRTASRVFPNARYFMVEGNDENWPQLDTATREISHSEYAIAVLGPEKKAEVVFHVNDQGSSVLPELTSFATQERRVPMVRLDDLMAERAAGEPILLKLDTQGYELEVLRGAPLTLARSEVVILEASLLPYNQGAPLFAEVISFMAESGFAAYDFCGEHRRESDNALFQIDVVFTKVNSQLRAKKKFWMHE
jgi:FkbM family methyltransferase